ncbi:MAG: hypothetical protein O2807_08950 [bacterium]|nr:hypothetical protein [bacterium]
MPDWIQVLLQYSVTGGVVAGVIGFLSRSLIKHFFDKELESFKSQATNEQKKIEILLNERAIIIKDIYHQIVATHSAFQDYMNPSQFTGEGLPTKDEKGDLAAENARKLISLIQKNIIYFNVELSKKLERLEETLRKIWLEYEISNESGNKDYKKAFAVYKDVSEGLVPEIRRDLAGEFRRLLGVNFDRTN